MNDKNKLPLEEWQKLCDDATPGPWESNTDGDVVSLSVSTDDPERREAVGLGPPKDICTSSAYRRANDSDPKFIAMARTAVPALITRVRELESENMCDSCGGTGTPTSNRLCICGGSGKASDAVAYLRSRVFELEGKIFELEGEDIKLKFSLADGILESTARLILGSFEAPKVQKLCLEILEKRLRDKK